MNEPLTKPGLGPNPAQNEKAGMDLKTIVIQGDNFVMYRAVAERKIEGQNIEHKEAVAARDEEIRRTVAGRDYERGR